MDILRIHPMPSVSWLHICYILLQMCSYFSKTVLWNAPLQHIVCTLQRKCNRHPTQERLLHPVCH